MWCSNYVICQFLLKFPTDIMYCLEVVALMMCHVCGYCVLYVG
jgi:hypothetical protein